MSGIAQELAALSLASIAYRCQQETDRFWQGEAYLPHYCQELFRRALADPHRAESKVAWTFVHQRYHRQAMLWVKEHRWFPQTNQAAADLADLALAKMWLVFAATPDKFARFPQADVDKCLRSLLKFLKLCVHSVVVDTIHAANDAQRQVPVDDEALAAHFIRDPDPLTSAAFWQCLYERLANEKEKLVMDASFMESLKPRQIYALYPDRFADVKEIHRIKENVLERLRRDAGLRACLEND